MAGGRKEASSAKNTVVYLAWQYVWSSKDQSDAKKAFFYNILFISTMHEKEGHA
jgi:hypothetical protein